VWWLGLVLLVGGDHFPYGRFVIPLLPLVAAAIGLEHTLDKSMQAQWPTQVILAMLLVASNYALLALPDLDRARKEVYLARAWKSVGEWLSTNLPQDAVVALTAVGSLPYYAERDTVDMLGLTDRHIAVRGGFFSEGHPGHQRYDSTYVLEREPMIIVLPWSGRYTKAAFMEHEWPRFADEDLPYVFALADLLSLSETRRRYQYRATLLPNGTYLDALWRRDVVSGFESHRPRIANQLQ